MAKLVRGRQTKSVDRNAVLEHVAATLATLVEELQGTRQVTPPVKVARGTRDVVAEAREAQKVTGETPTVLSTRDRVRDVLRENTMSLQELTKALALDLTAEEIAAEVKACAKEGLVSNIGAEDFPMWTWRIGDSTSAKELEAYVRRLITERPMTTKELTHASGARMTRVGGAIVAIQRSGDQVLDLNPKTRAGRWFIVTPAARDARLASKSPSKVGE